MTTLTKRWYTFL